MGGEELRNGGQREKVYCSMVTMERKQTQDTEHAGRHRESGGERWGKGYSGASENKQTNLRLMLQMNVERTEKPQPKTTPQKETPKIRDTYGQILDRLSKWGACNGGRERQNVVEQLMFIVTSQKSHNTLMNSSRPAWVEATSYPVARTSGNAAVRVLSNMVDPFAA